MFVSPGGLFGFAGLAMTDRPVMDILGVLNLNVNPHDFRGRLKAARCFGAAKRAVLALQEYYRHLLGLDPAAFSMQLFPYPTTFAPLAPFSQHTQTSFAYTERFGKKISQKHLLYYGSMVQPGAAEAKVMIKFVSRYGSEVHVLCASRKHAPNLYGFESLPGGWFMVVMESMEGYTTLSERQAVARLPAFVTNLKKIVEKLHQEEMVHGDIRAENVLVNADGTDVRLIDFDWAGKIGVARYPPNLNPVISWPEGASDNEFITVAHDDVMMNRLFPSGP